MKALLESFLSVPSNGREGAFRDLLAGLRAVVKVGGYEDAAPFLRGAALPTLDFTSTHSLFRIYRRVRAGLPEPYDPVRVAILGGSVTTTQLAQFIELHLFAAGIDAAVYESDFDVLRQEILDPASGLYGFGPGIVFLATSWRDLTHTPALDDSVSTVEELAAQELAHWAALWQTVHETTGCQVVQNNFDAPPARVLANREMRHPAALGSYVARVNQALCDNAPPYVTIHDLDHLSAGVGRWTWADARFHFLAKMPCAPECLVDYAHSVVSVMAAQLGRAKKCLVLGLDNTLWGGVIGDDGLGGIRLGLGNAEGEAFLAIQQYAKDLRGRGVILAVCSKNEESIAREPFERFSEMALRLDDIACFVANWNDKAANLRTIAQQLDIGLDSLVFVDDNPVERALVRSLAPEVAVPELPEDPAAWIPTLEQYRYFQVASIQAEDSQHADYYQANAARQQVEPETGSLDGFLRSLDMKARVEPIGPDTLERSTQLLDRSNQFNLTTRRHTSAQILAMIGDDAWVTRSVSLTDRFGDTGLISVLLAKVDGGVLDIDTWLMSCRVLKRGVEAFLMNQLYDLARERGVSAIRGTYIPTARNALVRDHYATLGFTQVDAPEDGTTRWELAVTNDWAALETFIEEESADG